MVSLQELDPVFVSEILQTQTTAWEITNKDELSVECTHDMTLLPLCPRCRRFTIKSTDVVCVRCTSVLARSN